MNDTHNKPRLRAGSAIQSDGSRRVQMRVGRNYCAPISQSQTCDARGTRARAFQTHPLTLPAEMPAKSAPSACEARADATRCDCSLEQAHAAAARVPPQRASSWRAFGARLRGASAGRVRGTRPRALPVTLPPLPPHPLLPPSPFSLPGSFCAIFFPSSYLDGKISCSVYFWKD